MTTTNSEFKIYKTETEYSSNQLLYGSEVWSYNNTNPLDVIKLRALPNEITTSQPKLMFNISTTPVDYTGNTTSYYIEKGNYVDAVHRLMYLTLIKGQENINLFQFMKDDGLMHELLHLKTNYSTPDLTSLIQQADDFEQSVPGTLLWVMANIMT